VDRYAVGPDCTEAEFLAAVRVYARDVVARHDLSVAVSALDWSVSTRAKRRAGAVLHRDGEPQSVVLTWEQFAEAGWAAAAATVRHELVHVHRLNEAGDATHGAAFRRLADRLDAPFSCARFAEPAYWVVCRDCDARLARYRRSKLVTEPDSYRCGDCGGRFRVARTEE
jgi:predicted SprT family Zn-dependent metalloprotease